MNRRAFLLGSAAAAGAQAVEGPGTWVRRAYSFLWSREEPSLLPEEEPLIYLDTESAFGFYLLSEYRRLLQNSMLAQQQWMEKTTDQLVEQNRRLSGLFRGGRVE